MNHGHPVHEPTIEWPSAPIIDVITDEMTPPMLPVLLKGVLGHNFLTSRHFIKPSLCTYNFLANSWKGYGQLSTLTEGQYNRLSNSTLEQLCDSFERLGERADIVGFDCEYSNGVLALRMGNKGTFVINRQPPNKQIWLSSPISGPKRYDFSLEQKKWKYSRDARSLDELLSEELTQLLGMPVHVSIKA